MCTLSLDQNLPWLCMFVDLAKEFDTVSHSLLLKTLEDVGYNYVSNRTQCVRISDILSETLKIIEYEVPQGKVLGPILFK